jgi:hypothetical protein
MSSPLPHDIFSFLDEAPHLLTYTFFLCQQYPNQSTDGPLHFQHLGIGTPINNDTGGLLTPGLAQPSGDRWKSSGVPRVFGLAEILFGGTLGQQPYNTIIIGGGLAVPPCQLSYQLPCYITFQHIFSQRDSSFLRHNFQGWKQKNPRTFSQIIAWQGCDDPIGSPWLVGTRSALYKIQTDGVSSTQQIKYEL